MRRVKNQNNGSNLEARVYEQVYSLISNRDYLDPSSLNDKNLAEQLGVSRTPVRMALARLESEGMVVKIDGKGWVVTPLSMADIKEIFDLKEVLETHVARKAAENITPEKALELLAVVEEMKEISKENNVQKWFAADSKFHGLLLELVGNGRLETILKRINNQYFRFAYGFMTMDGQIALMVKEHAQMADAIVSQKPDQAAEYTLKHLQDIRTLVVNIIKNIIIPFMGRGL